MQSAAVPAVAWAIWASTMAHSHMQLGFEGTPNGSKALDLAAVSIEVSVFDMCATFQQKEADRILCMPELGHAFRTGSVSTTVAGPRTGGQKSWKVFLQGVFACVILRLFARRHPSAAH